MMDLFGFSGFFQWYGPGQFFTWLPLLITNMVIHPSGKEFIRQACMPVRSMENVFDESIGSKRIINE